MAIELLMSSCLIGQCCRWDAKNGRSVVTPRLHLMLNHGQVAVICPECAGGLDVPRPAAEIEPGKNAADVLSGNARVINTGKADVTAQYVAGAKAALALVKKHNIRVAILKAKSPSCGSREVYDGTFSGKLKEGRGVTAELLASHGVKVFDETQIDEALALLDAMKASQSEA